jgi:uncharacterized protein YbjT (DUF2867 family)
MEQRIAWVAGASGLVGKSLVEQLAGNPAYSTVVAFVRRLPKDKPSSPKIQYFVCDWLGLCASEKKFKAPDSRPNDIFCALGSTKKRTPNKNDYYKIDVEYPIAFAKLGLKYGARFYGLVSAHGASGRTPSFYLTMKTHAEEGLRALNYPHLSFARPGLLKGDRSEFRFVERAAEVVCDLLPGNFKAIDGRDVAAALVRAAADSHETSPYTEVLESKTMQGAFKGS